MKWVNLVGGIEEVRCFLLFFLFVFIMHVSTPVVLHFYSVPYGIVNISFSSSRVISSGTELVLFHSFSNRDLISTQGAMVVEFLNVQNC